MWWLILLVVVGVCFPFLKVKRQISYENKHVLITGGSKGLGKAIALKMAKEGAHISIFARDQMELQKAKIEIEKQKKNSSQRILTFVADVTNEDQLNIAVEQAILANGVTDIVILCAGKATPGLMVDTPNKVYREMINLNYLGCVFTVKAVLPKMIERNQGGRIVFVSSAAALTSFVGYSQYCPSKWAVRALGDSLRNELKLYGIQVTQFYPSNMDTEGFEIEELTKPAPTKEIEGTAKLFKPEEAAEHFMQGLSAGQYHITSEFMVDMLRSALNGTTPRNYWMLELLLSPILVIASEGLKWYMDWVVLKSKGKLKAN